MKTNSDGSVLMTAQGRRTITTATAYQKMVKPFYGGLSSWNSFIRLYQADLNKPRYSTLLVGSWDTLTEQGGGNTEIFGVYKTNLGILAVGRHTALNGVSNGNPIPVAHVPNWGNSLPLNESGIIAYYKDDLLINPTDIAGIKTGWNENESWEVYPNPTDDSFFVKGIAGQTLKLLDIRGMCIQEIYMSNEITEVSICNIPSGIYFISSKTSSKKIMKW